MGGTFSKNINNNNQCCLSQPVKERSTLRMLYEPHILDDSQLEAVIYISKSASVNSAKAKSRLASKLPSEKINFILEYIEHTCPMMIHFNLHKLSVMLKDSHYRNGHEIGSLYGCCSNRRQAEERMFSKASNYGTCPDSKLPKYGVLDLYNEGCPLRSCEGYGKGIFILSSDIRNRVTISNGDSLAIRDKTRFGTCDQFAHILNSFSEAKLLRILRSAKGKGACAYTSRSFGYKEIQIHGMVKFGRDIVELRIPKDSSEYIEANAEKFANRFNIKLSHY
jgi:hypothetical protein